MVRVLERFRLSTVCLVLSVLTLVTPPLSALSFAAETARLKLQMGTPVDLQFDAAVSGEVTSIGQQVSLKVSVPVMVDGKVVIAGGAPAVGEVVAAKKSGMVGMAGTLSVMIKQVTAVDGTIVPLTGTRAIEGKSNTTTSVVIAVVCCILGLLIKGEKAEIPAGATVRATVAVPVEVAVP